MECQESLPTAWSHLRALVRRDDSKRGVTVVFGGVDDSGFLGDLWAWTGASGGNWLVASSRRPGSTSHGTNSPTTKGSDQSRPFRRAQRDWPDGDLNDTYGNGIGATWRRIGN